MLVKILIGGRFDAERIVCRPIDSTSYLSFQKFPANDTVHAPHTAVLSLTIFNLGPKYAHEDTTIASSRFSFESIMLNNARKIRDIIFKDYHGFAGVIMPVSFFWVPYTSVSAFLITFFFLNIKTFLNSERKEKEYCSLDVYWFFPFFFIASAIFPCRYAYLRIYCVHSSSRSQTKKERTRKLL